MPRCRDCYTMVTEEMYTCPVCGKSLRSPRYCEQCNRQISQERFDNYRGLCVGCARKTHLMKLFGFALVVVGFIGMCYGLGAIFVSGVLASVSVIAIAGTVVCGVLLLVGLILLYLGFKD